MTVFSNSEMLLMGEIIGRWRPDLLELLERSSLAADEREELRGALAEELVAHGVNRTDWEPNKYGLKVEDLIDKVGRIPST